jgi:hypothetical protein
MTFPVAIGTLRVRRDNARQLHAELCPIVIAYRTEGLTLAAIAERLNGQPSPKLSDRARY